MAQVPLARKLAFSASGLGGCACLVIANAYLMYFYTDLVGLNIGLVGLALSITRVFDALNDPIIGYMSDKTHTRWGRRRPWIAAGAIPGSLTFALLFQPPNTTDQYLLFFYLLLVFFVCDIFATMCGVPGFALTAELSSDYQERTQIFALCTFFNNVGTILGGFLPFAVALFADLRIGYARVTLWAALISVLFTLLALFAPERPDALRGATAGFHDFCHGYLTCLRHRLFRTLLMTCFLLNVGMWIGYAVGVYALVYWLGFALGEIGFIYPVWLGASCLFLPFWTWLSGRIGKEVALKWVLLYGAAMYFALYFLTPNKLLVYMLVVFSGFGLAGFVALPSLLADVLDVDELDTGAQRAGTFLGLWNLITKGATAIGPLVAGWILDALGYVPNAQQGPHVIEALRWLYGPVPGIFCLISYIVFRNFSLTREHVNEIQAELSRRRTLSEGRTEAGSAGSV